MYHLHIVETRNHLKHFKQNYFFTFLHFILKSQPSLHYGKNCTESASFSNAKYFFCSLKHTICCKGLPGTNTLAYYKNSSITDVKCFTRSSPELVNYENKFVIIFWLISKSGIFHFLYCFLPLLRLCQQHAGLEP